MLRTFSTDELELPADEVVVSRHSKWLGWGVVALIPFVGFGLFLFHFIAISAGAAGGCGGG